MLLPHLEHFLNSDQSLEAQGIVIGNWGGEDSMEEVDPALEKLCSKADRLPSLVAIYLGDITMEENEMSWIQQSDVSRLLTAFPNLQLLRTRGADGLALKTPKHDALRALALETGGMSVDVVRSVAMSEFPNLEYLELWLGTDNYGGNSSVQDLQPILSGTLFPKLKYLGLRNCDYVDDIAAVVVNSPIIEQIETLDLSLGTLTDEGGQALLSLEAGGTLQRVNLHHHFLTNEVIKQLKAHAIPFDVSNRQEDDEFRFVAVGE